MPDATTLAPQAAARMRCTRTVLAGFAFALGAGVFWGTTGPLSTALYSEGANLTDVGFWRVLLAVLGFLAYAALHPSLLRFDARAWLLVGGLGGLFVALFEVAFQYAIAGVGVASAVALLYTAPVLVAILARPLLGEALTRARLITAGVVMVGVWLAVTGGASHGGAAPTRLASRLGGVAGGLLAACSFAGSTLIARWAVPRWGAVRVLLLELLGGVLILAAALPIAGRTPVPPSSLAGWLYVLALGAGAVLAANFCYFAAVRRIDAAPTAVGASIEPVVGALLALALFGQRLTEWGWLGLALVVGGVAGGYALERNLSLPDVEESKGHEPFDSSSH